MVDFRYHLITIISVFLALAVGLVVGTVALGGPVLDGLRGTTTALASDKRALESDVRGLQTDLASDDGFARTVSEELVAGRLAGQRVLVVSAPGADGRMIDQVSAALVGAGAVVTGRLAVQPTLLDPAQGQLVDDIVARVVPAGVELPQGRPAARAAGELAAALTVRAGRATVDRTKAQEVVSAFQEAGLIDLTGQGKAFTTAGSVVVVSAPAPAALVRDDKLSAALDGLLALAGAFDAASAGAVVAGPPEAARDGGLIGLLRSDPARRDAVSSVDNADRAVGQVGVVLALREQLAGGGGQYGSGTGAAAAVPAAVPKDPAKPTA